MKRIAFVCIVGCIIAAVFYFVHRNSDEYRIKKSLKTLAAVVSKPKNTDEQGIAFLKKVAIIRSLFSRDCSVIFAEPVPKVQGFDEIVPELHGIEEVLAVYHQAMRSVSEITVTFHDIATTIEENRTTAETVMTAKAVCPDCYEGDEGIDAREVEVEWKKNEGKWEIVSVKEVKTLY